MKDMLFGLTAGLIAGAVLVRNCKSCERLVDDVTAMVESKMAQGSAAAKKSTQCECGSDCGCTGTEN